MTPEETLALAEEHWKFLERREHATFVEAWVHSAKHEREYLISQGWQAPSEQATLANIIPQGY